MNFNFFTWVFLVLFVAHGALEIWIELLQVRHLTRRKDQVPRHLEGKVDIETIRKSVLYNREKLLFHLLARLFGAVLLWAFIMVGFSSLDNWVAGFELGSIGSGLIFLGAVGAIGLVAGLPQELYFTFVIEQKHGFNRQRLGGFFMDKLKGIIISAVIGTLLILLVLFLFEKAGEYWWIFAFCAVTAVQIFAAWLYPVVIMPIFSKFEKVEGSLAEEISVLAKKVGFPLGQVVSMDGSKRSTHSNAFIVGLFGARRIVLYDTLIEKLSRLELLAVLAHELGHFRLGHIRNRLIIMVVGLFGVFALMGWIVANPDVSIGLGFEKWSSYAALISSVLLISEALSPFSWLLRVMSRRDEYAADRFAVRVTGNSDDLSNALIGLTKQNLGSPGSHRYYRGYYNTHPALRDRLRSIKKNALNLNTCPD